MYKNIRRKEMIKNVVYISVILLIAMISTYLIYYKFVDERQLDSSSDVFDVTYHDNSGNKISITKVTPVTDSVGLSTNYYGMTLKNNLTEKIYVRITIKDDIETILNDHCEEYLISKNDIRISIKSGKKDNKIYTLSELVDGVLIDETLNALEQKEISIRIWVGQNSTLPLGSNIHYHGMIDVEELDSINRMSYMED